ncbi:hypothetical protein BD413DRAFT_490152 [Trametes elegans]|nr:hypothetical protein BD413DRAFT_490152 [Trametes elegans]
MPDQSPEERTKSQAAGGGVRQHIHCGTALRGMSMSMTAERADVRGARARTTPSAPEPVLAARYPPVALPAVRVWHGGNMTRTWPCRGRGCAVGPGPGIAAPVVPWEAVRPRARAGFQQNVPLAVHDGLPRGTRRRKRAPRGVLPRARDGSRSARGVGEGPEREGGGSSSVDVDGEPRCASDEAVVFDSAGDGNAIPRRKIEIALHQPFPVQGRYSITRALHRRTLGVERASDGSSSGLG